VKNIYVGNLNFGATEETVRLMFEKYGTVDRINLVTDEDTGQPKGYAFVEMPNDDEALKVISAVNGIDARGRTLVVNEARPKRERPSGSTERRPKKRNRFRHETPRTPPQRQILT
jgi:RNA recognition motif-containing protein